MRTIGILAIVAALVAGAAVPAYAKGPEDFFAAGVVAEKEGDLKRAEEMYRLVIQKWPDDQRARPKAHLRLIEVLARQGRLDEARDWIAETEARYREHPQILAELGGPRGQIDRLAALAAQAAAKAEEENARLDALEAELKAQGLSGDALRAAFEEKAGELRRAEEAHRRAMATDRLKAMLEESARTQEALKELQQKQAELQRLAEVQRAELARRQEEIRRLKEHVGETAAKLPTIEEWKEATDRNLEQARRQFIELAEQFGIPGKEAARFLDEHRAGRPGGDWTSSPGGDEKRERPPEMELVARLKKIEARLAEIEKRLGLAADRVEHLDAPRPEKERGR